MRTLKPTPGPWRVVLHSTKMGEAPYCVAAGPVVVARAMEINDDGSFRIARAEANAACMAAAPEMLEVLREVAESPYRDSDLESLLETLRTRARVAIAKAEGRS